MSTDHPYQGDPADDAHCAVCEIPREEHPGWRNGQAVIENDKQLIALMRRNGWPFPDEV